MQFDKLEVKQDSRGQLYEAFKTRNGQIFVATINPGETRGNHYHKRKIEKFLVVEGSAHIVNRDRTTSVTSTYLGKAEQPIIVTIPPNNTHRITSKNGCILICHVDELFDENDPDTYSEEV